MIEVNTTNDNDSTEFLDHMAAIRLPTPRYQKAVSICLAHSLKEMVTEKWDRITSSSSIGEGFGDWETDPSQPTSFCFYICTITNCKERLELKLTDYPICSCQGPSINNEGRLLVVIRVIVASHL